MSLLRQLWYFSFRMVKESILLVLLALDLIGALVTYFQQVQN
jgi:hypothetical protein